ncbi:MAG: DUF697 domain-containing protein [Gammaproteobacteria bacterium]|nr:DUF697 domain-containing protein [Gammaproteobacteria bacterium]
MATDDWPRGPVLVDPTPAAAAVPPEPRGPVMVTGTDPAAAPTDWPDPSPPGRTRGPARGRWLAAALVLLLAALTAYDTGLFLAEVFARSRALGVLFSLLLTGVMLTLAGWVRGLLLDLRRIRAVSALRARGEALARHPADPELVAGLTHYCQDLAAHYRDDPARRDCLARLAGELAEADHGGELEGRQGMLIISQRLYAETDRQALERVVQRAQQAALMTAIAPLAVIDLLIVFWRSLSLLREIATLYGGRPGRLGLLTLARLSLENLVFAEVSQQAADTLGQVLGDRVLATLSAQAAQGLGVGLMLGRLGSAAIRLCRPVPFIGAEPHAPSFGKLYGAMVTLITAALARPADGSSAGTMR